MTLVPIVTEGDRTGAPLREVGGRGLFTKALQQALLDEAIDLAVHSLKDLATAPVAGLRLAAVLERGPMADVLVTGSGEGLGSLPEHARVGTGSPRRAAQLLWLRPDLEIVGLRGNVGTRLEKLTSDDLDAIVLAEAGLVRLGLGERIGYRFPLTEMLPAAGQGAIGVECRAADGPVCRLLERFDHAATRACVTAERAVLERLEAGCLAPVGTAALLLDDHSLHIEAVVLDERGKRRVAAEVKGSPERSRFLGELLAVELLDQGAAELIAASRDR